MKAKEYKYATVKFLSTYGPRETFTFENPVGAKKYDAVLVDTRHGIAIAVVTAVTNDVSNLPCHTPCKQVLEVVKSKVIAGMTIAEKKAELKKKLEKLAKEMDSIKMFEIYAKNNPEFSQLLEEYKSVQ